MQDLFLDFIKEKTGLAPGEKVLLAVSGGLDSVVMAHLFQHAPHTYGIAHVNFGLRAEESEEDARFVASLAAALQVPFHTTRLAAAEYAREKGVSIQMAARDLRYQWFETLCLQEGYDAIATAHHLNDFAETMLLNLSRGTGLAGLHGIATRRGKLVRPLLFARREQLEAYAHEKELQWREDSSNRSLKYRRNKIRQLVIPVLKELNPRLEEAFMDTASQVRAAEHLLQGLVEILRPQLLKEQEGHHYLHLPRLLEEREPRFLLAALLEPFSGGWHEAGAILERWHKPVGALSGKWFATATHRLTMDRDQLVISPLVQETSKTVELICANAQVKVGGWQLFTRRVSASEYTISTNPQVAALDLHKLQFPLHVRTPQPGDWFIPLGMKGKKKLSDFMIDRKIPVNLKQEVLVIQSADSIAWVAGYRPDERFKIDSHTQEVFEIRLQKT